MTGLYTMHAHIRHAAVLLALAAALVFPFPRPGNCDRPVRVLVMDDVERLALHLPYGYEFRQGVSGGVGGGAMVLSGPDEDTIVLEAGEGSPSGIRLHADGSVVKINEFALSGVVEVTKNERGLYRIVNELGLERYTAAVVSDEISPGWPIEALKAQAVVARTYALYRQQKSACADYDLCAGVNSQVFAGDAEIEPGPARAARQTEGFVLSYGGALAETPYHSTCGGKTEAACDVWDWKIDYLVARDCPCPAESPYRLWTRNVPADEAARALRKNGYAAGGVTGISVTERSPAGRAKKVRVEYPGGSVTLKGDELRRVLGYQALPSTYFKVKKVADYFSFTGSGSGHGVGLCQWGAKVMAEQGRGYREILMHYYPGVKLARIKEGSGEKSGGEARR